MANQNDTVLGRIREAKVSGQTTLYLGRMDITTLPDEIGELTNLTELDLNNNQLTELPEVISKLTNLTKLFLYNNQLTELPEVIAQLTKLTMLNLSNNQLTELPEGIAQLTKLNRLDLGNNQLTAFPEGVTQLTKLTELYLMENQLTELPEVIAQLTNLTRLYLSNNQLTELPEGIAQLTKLTKLFLNNNQLTELPEVIAQLTKLTELDLSNNQLTELPEVIAQLTKLMELYLSNNQLTELPEVIAQLTKLMELNLSNNQLTELPEVITQLTKLTMLNLGNNQLTELPEGIAQLTTLTELDLNNNQLTELPKVISNLTNLTWLNLMRNQLSELPKEISKLTNLNSLYLMDNQLTSLPREISELNKLSALGLSSNQFTELPKEISKLTNLTRLYLSTNKLVRLPEFLFQHRQLTNIDLINKFDSTNNTIYLFNNNIESPPLETLQGGIEKVRAYFQELKTQKTSKVYEAKLLIVGEPDSGKTSLARKIIDPTCDLPNRDETTRGIDINYFNFTTEEGNDFKINIWDFGGQQIYHATHRYFLTKSSFYILLSDNRAENTDFEYWLHLTGMLSDSSPLIIVQNEKEGRKKQLEMAAMQGQFAHLKKAMQVDLKTDKVGLEKIIKEVKHEIQLLPHIGTELPQPWIDIRNALEKLGKEQSYISQEQYFEVCKQHTIPERERALNLSSFLHNLGSILHFQDNIRLSNSVILKPTWATDAVYKIVDTLNDNGNKGFFSEADAITIWKEDRFKDMIAQLLELMQTFEICYKIQDKNEYIIPQLLSVDKPKYLLDGEDSLTLRFKYKFLPKGIIHRLIVKTHRLIKDNDPANYAWNTGVFLEKEGSQAEVVEIYAANEIEIKVVGFHKIEMLNSVIEKLDEIHASYPSTLEVQKLIPCNCSECKKSKKPYLFEYDNLRKALRKGKQTRECGNSFDDISIMPLLGLYFPTMKLQRDIFPERAREIPKIFISYSHKDEAYKDELEKWLTALGWEMDFIVWQDRELVAGDDWKKEILQNLEEADVIIFLVSVDFMASKFIREIEYKIAMERHERKEVSIFPIILKSCDAWKRTPMGKIQVMPRDAKPISSFEESDDAWNEIAEGIRKSLQKKFPHSFLD